MLKPNHGINSKGIYFNLGQIASLQRGLTQLIWQKQRCVNLQKSKVPFYKLTKMHESKGVSTAC